MFVDRKVVRGWISIVGVRSSGSKQQVMQTDDAMAIAKDTNKKLSQSKTTERVNGCLR